jgi:hypothetical protein
MVDAREKNRRLAVFLVCGLALTGCVTTGPDRGEAVSPAPPTQSVTQTTTIPKTEEIASVVALPKAVPEIVPQPEPEPLVPGPDPASLVGYDRAALENLFGKPSFTRRDPPAELWQYRNDRCTLDLFLYEGASGGYSVEHLEFREMETSAESTEHCLNAIIEQKLAASGSS